MKLVYLHLPVPFSSCLHLQTFRVLACCNKDSGSHSMVLDGIEGFVPTKSMNSDRKYANSDA